MHCFLKTLRKLDKWKTKGDERHVLKKTGQKKSSKHLTCDLGDASHHSIYPHTLHSNLIRNGLSGRLPVRKSFLRTGSRRERLRYAKLHKNCNDNQYHKIVVCVYGRSQEAFDWSWNTIWKEWSQTKRPMQQKHTWAEIKHNGTWLAEE